MIQEESINKGLYDPTRDELSLQTQEADLRDGAEDDVRLLLGANRALVGVDVNALNGRIALMIGAHEDVRSTLTVRARFKRRVGSSACDIIIAEAKKYVQVKG